jgi:hypothetical protein
MMAPPFLIPFEVIIVATIELRNLHLVKKALAISVLVMERQGGHLQSSSDKLDMKLLLERLADTPELEHYTRLHGLLSQVHRQKDIKPRLTANCLRLKGQEYACFRPYVHQTSQKKSSLIL